MLIDNSDLGLSGSNKTSAGFSGSDWFGLAAAGLDAATDIYNNERNISLQKSTNAQNEALMRESWAREDNAVQRRVADLKAAGLSPTLAAGSAAASGSPVSLQAPKSNLKGGYGAQTLAALSAIRSLKAQQLQNEGLSKENEIKDEQLQYLKNQNRYYGLPDWWIALNRALGSNNLTSWLSSIFQKWFGVDGDQDPPAPSFSPSEPSKPSIPGQVSKTTYTEEYTPGVVRIIGIDKRYSFEDNMTSIMIDLHQRGLSGNKDVLNSVIYNLMDAYGMSYDKAAEEVYYWRNEVDRPTR